MVEIVVHDRNGLAALGRLDELGICEAYMAGSLDIVGDMLLFGRSKTNRQAIATHYEFDDDFLSRISRREAGGQPVAKRLIP